MDRSNHIFASAVQPLAALVLALVLVVALPMQAQAKGKTFRGQFALPMGQVMAPSMAPTFAPGVAPVLLPAVQQGTGYRRVPGLGAQPQQRPGVQLWLASNVDSAYLAGVRDGRFVTLKRIKNAIQAFTGAPLKRVLSISMVNRVLVLSVEDVYSNIFDVRVRPETAEVLP